MAARRTRIKICGVTREADARRAAMLGADAIGLVFHSRSPRCLDGDQAAAVARSLPPFVTTVGLFLDSDPGFVAEMTRHVGLDLLQLHGDESPEYCAEMPRPYIKAVAMADIGDARSYIAAYPDARGFVLDSHALGQTGGSGRAFDWSAVPETDLSIILAGGLTPDNVAEAVRRIGPWGVDVSSGVESAPGAKDAERMAAFIRAADRAGVPVEV